MASAPTWQLHRAIVSKSQCAKSAAWAFKTSASIQTSPIQNAPGRPWAIRCRVADELSRLTLLAQPFADPFQGISVLRSDQHRQLRPCHQGLDLRTALVCHQALLCCRELSQRGGNRCAGRRRLFCLLASEKFQSAPHPSPTNFRSWIKSNRIHRSRVVIQPQITNCSRKPISDWAVSPSRITTERLF